MDIRTCGKPELNALNARAKAWRDPHSPNPDVIKDQSATPQDLAGADEGSTNAFTNWPASSFLG